MTFLDEHLEWLTSQGVEVLDLGQADRIAGVPDGLPEEVALWFQERVPRRVEPFAPLGYFAEGFWLEPAMTEPMFSFDPGYAEGERAAGLFPEHPIGIADFVDDYLTAETHGERTGWIYLNEAASPENGGPIATSLSQMFYAVRQLTSARLLDPTDPGFEHRVNPPPDTPWHLLGPWSGPSLVGTDHNPPDIFSETPVAASIRDLLPDFEFPHDP